jgi:anti-anti-sigma factor
MAEMTISHHEITSGVVAVAISGSMTISSAPEEIDLVTDHLLGAGKHTIIFDLAAVTGMDSTGIGRFIASYKKITAAGGRMCIAGATGHVADVLHVSKLDTVIPVYLTVGDAATT